MDIEVVNKNPQRALVEMEYVAINAAPSAIKVIKHNNGLIAVGRDNGVIQVYRDRSFIVVGHYFSGAQSAITGIIWLDDESFLSSQLSGVVTLFHLSSMLPKTFHQLAPSICIYSMAQLSPSMFVVSCSDGTLKLIAVDEKLTSSFQTQAYPDIQALSVSVFESHVYATYSNGQIRQYLYKAPHVLQLVQSVSLAIAETALAKSKAPIPWCVAVTSSFVFVGTSHGQVHVFERQFFTEVKKLQTHHASVLCAVVLEESVIYFSGTDSKVVSVDVATLQIVGEVRGQSNDVFALECLPEQRVVSSGVNADLCIYLHEQVSHRVAAQPHKSQIEVQECGGKRRNLLLALNNYTNVQLMTPSPDSDDMITLAELQAPQNIHLVRLSAKYVLYSHAHQTVLLKLVWDGQSLSSMQKLHTMEPIIEAVFGRGQSLYFLNAQGGLYQLELQNQKRTFVANTGVTSPTRMLIMGSLLIITSVREQRLVSYDLDKKYESQEASLGLAAHTLHEISVVQGQNINVVAIHSNNRFTVHVYSPKLDATLVHSEWRLSQHSKQFLYQFPKDYLSYKYAVQGAISDGLDEKRLLLFTQHSLIKAHLRGKPPTQMTPLTLASDATITLNDNFTVLDLQNCIIDLITLPRAPKRKSQVLCVQWDKEQSFRDLPPAFNAKKYKQ